MQTTGNGIAGAMSEEDRIRAAAMIQSLERALASARSDITQRDAAFAVAQHHLQRARQETEALRKRLAALEVTAETAAPPPQASAEH